MNSGTIQEILTDPLGELGFDIVQVIMTGSQSKVLEIMIERKDGQPVSVIDCKTASKEASAHLDVEDLIKSAYTLEVTSPGIDRPLIKPSDFEKNINKFVKITTSVPIEDRKKFKGRLLEFKDNIATVEATFENEEIKRVDIPFDDIHKANLAPRFDGIKILYT